MTNQYNNYEPDWKVATTKDGREILKKDKAGMEHKTYVSEELILRVKTLGQYGGAWLLERPDGQQVDGFYSNNFLTLVVGKTYKMVLGLGIPNAKGQRYKNIITAYEQEESQQPEITSKEEFVAPEEIVQEKTPYQEAEEKRNQSIREQAFYNNLNYEILECLPIEKRSALLKAWFDTGMLMLRPEVRERALELMNDILSAEEAKKQMQEEQALEKDDVTTEETLSPSVAKAVELGGKIIEPKEETEETTTTDDNEEVTELKW